MSSSLKVNGVAIGMSPTGFPKCGEIVDALFPRDPRNRDAARAAMETTYVDDLDSIVQMLVDSTTLSREQIVAKITFPRGRPRRGGVQRAPQEEEEEPPKRPTKTYSRKRALPKEEESCVECGAAPRLVPDEKHCRKCFFQHTAVPQIERLEQRVEQLEARRTEAAVARLLDRYHNTLFSDIVSAEVALDTAPGQRAWETLRDLLKRAHALLDEAPEQQQQQQVQPPQEDGTWERDVQELRELAQRIGSLAGALHTVADTPSIRSELVVTMDGLVTRARRLCMRPTEPAFSVSERLRHWNADPVRYNPQTIGRRAVELFRLRYPGREPARRFSAAGDIWFNVYTESECPHTLDKAILEVI